MTGQRYRYYLRALALIDSLDHPALVGDGGKDVLRELAEDLLLTRDGEDDEARDRIEHGAVVLAHLTTAGAVTRPVASDLWRMLRAAGPQWLVEAEPLEATGVSAA